eukprot:scaffold13796_cov118-Isochrysis_galbana.AAC.9
MVSVRDTAEGRSRDGDIGRLARRRRRRLQTGRPLAGSADAARAGLSTAGTCADAWVGRSRWRGGRRPLAARRAPSRHPLDAQDWLERASRAHGLASTATSASRWSTLSRCNSTSLSSKSLRASKKASAIGENWVL